MNEPTEQEREFFHEGWGTARPASPGDGTSHAKPMLPKTQVPKTKPPSQMRVNSPAKDWLALNAVWIFSVSFATLSVCGWLFNFLMNPL